MGTHQVNVHHTYCMNCGRQLIQDVSLTRDTDSLIFVDYIMKISSPYCPNCNIIPYPNIITDKELSLKKRNPLLRIVHWLLGRG